MPRGKKEKGLTPKEVWDINRERKERDAVRQIGLERINRAARQVADQIALTRASQRRALILISDPFRTIGKRNLEDILDESRRRVNKLDDMASGLFGMIESFARSEFLDVAKLTSRARSFYLDAVEKDVEKFGDNIVADIADALYTSEVIENGVDVFRDTDGNIHAGESRVDATASNTIHKPTGYYQVGDAARAGCFRHEEAVNEWF